MTDAEAEALLRAAGELAALLDQTLEWLQGTEEGAARRILTLGDPGYPASLLEMADPPLMLYLLGAPALDLTQLGHSIAMVGSRNPTPQGTSNARAFARAFGEAGIPVVWGLALGVDGAAHEGALDAPDDPGRPATVAVVGTGLDRVYPASHRELAHRIAARGLIVSEFPLGTPPAQSELSEAQPHHRRPLARHAGGGGRAAVGLADHRQAGEQGKEVFAIPGSIHSPQSRGCHALIRQGAKLVETVGDVLEELRLEGATVSSAANPMAPDADADAIHGLLHDMGYDPVSLDALCARTGFSAAELQAQLLELELAGSVARLPGGLFQRIAQG